MYRSTNGYNVKFNLCQLIAILWFIDNPFNTILDGLGYQEKVKTQLNVAPVGFDQGANKAIWGLNFNMQF